MAANKLRDAGVVASVRAAEIYGLNVLSEKIQAMISPLFFNFPAFLLKHIFFLNFPIKNTSRYQIDKCTDIILQDDFGNITRYLVLAREPIIPRANKPIIPRAIKVESLSPLLPYSSGAKSSFLLNLGLC